MKWNQPPEEGAGSNTWLWSCSSIWRLEFNRRRIQTQSVPAGKDREWCVSLQGVEMHQQGAASVEGRRICQSWAYLWFSLKSTVSWRKVSDCWIWGCRGQPGYPGCGKRAWVGFGVWFYSPHKVIWIHWWCDGVLPESTALFLQEILCLAKCLGVRVRPWVPPRLGAPCPVLQNTKFQVSQSSVCMAGNSLLDVTRAGGGFGLGFHGNNRLNSD